MEPIVAFGIFCLFCWIAIIIIVLLSVSPKSNKNKSDEGFTKPEGNTVRVCRDIPVNDPSSISQFIDEDGDYSSDDSVLYSSVNEDDTVDASSCKDYNKEWRMCGYRSDESGYQGPPGGAVYTPKEEPFPDAEKTVWEWEIQNEGGGSQVGSCLWQPIVNEIGECYNPNNVYTKIDDVTWGWVPNNDACKTFCDPLTDRNTSHPEECDITRTMHDINNLIDPWGRCVNHRAYDTLAGRCDESCTLGTIDDCNNCVNDQVGFVNPFMDNCKLVQIDNLVDSCKASPGTKAYENNWKYQFIPHHTYDNKYQCADVCTN